MFMSLGMMYCCESSVMTLDNLLVKFDWEVIFDDDYSLQIYSSYERGGYKLAQLSLVMEEIGVLAQEPKPMLFLSVRICFVRMNTGQMSAKECKNMVM